MEFGVRELDGGDWPEFWPMLRDMGTDDDEPTARVRYVELVQDPRWGVLGLAEVSAVEGVAVEGGAVEGGAVEGGARAGRVEEVRERVGGRLVGYAAVQDYGPHLRLGNLHRIARMHDLYVRPEDRGRGAGRALMNGAASWAAGRVRYLEWQAGETTSAPFYAHLGYRGEPCPQPEYPTFVIDFRATAP